MHFISFLTDSEHSVVLKEIKVPLWQNSDCQSALRLQFGSAYSLPNTALCAGAEGHDACDVSLKPKYTYLISTVESRRENGNVLIIRKLLYCMNTILKKEYFPPFTPTVYIKELRVPSCILVTYTCVMEKLVTSEWSRSENI